MSKKCEHEWGIDGIHSNEYCKKCFITKPDDARRDVAETSILKSKINNIIDEMIKEYEGKYNLCVTEVTKRKYNYKIEALTDLKEKL